MSKKAIVTGAFVCVMLVGAAIAAEGVVGEWEFKSEMRGRTTQATMTITKAEDGKLSGTWSAQWGQSDLSDIKFENGKVSFVQTSSFGGQEMKTTYEGAVEGSKITGKGQGRFGEFTFEGALQGEPKTGADAIVGEWQMTVNVPAREVVEKLIITKNDDGTLAGKWVGQRGDSTISDLKFDAGKLTFTRTTKIGDREMTATFAGTVEGDSIKGTFSSERGDREANATRVGASKAKEDGKEEPNKPK